MGVETALIAAAVVSAAGAAAGAGASYAANKRQEGMAKEQEKAAKIQRQRDMSDLEKRRGASAASLRAAMAASGQTNTASADVLASSDAANFGVAKSRLLQDYTIQGGVLKARRQEYGTQATGALVKGSLDVAGIGAKGYSSSLQSTG